MTEDIQLFIKESNAIENIWDDQAIEDSLVAWDYLKNIEYLTLLDLLTIHKLILQRIDPKIAGKLRSELQVDVRIGNEICTRWYDVASKVCEWLYNAQNVKLNEERIKGIHVALLKIHPWQDGNGRTSRMIYNWMRLKAGYPLHIIYEKDKYNYYAWFK